MIGTQIGQYRIERELGRGGFGVVYVGLDLRLNRPAAIKQLLPELCNNHDIVKRFFNEAQAAAGINHPGIVEIYDVGWHTDGSAYFAMKFLHGDSLARRLRATGPMSIELAATLGRQIASALGAAHARDIVHRDLKPDNIVLVADDEVTIGERATVLDFGIAKLAGLQPTSQRTRTGMMMGTPGYMSPEQCRGAGEVDHRTDIYALGCILFEMLTGRPPFVGEGAGEVLGMHQFVEAPTVRSLRADVPPDFEAVVMRALAKKADQRLQTMPEMYAALQRFAAGGARSKEQVAQSSQAAMAQTVASVAELPRAVPDTTLSAAAASRDVAPTKKSSRAGLVIGGGVLAIGGIAVAIALGSSSKSSTIAATDPPDATTTPVVVADAATPVAIADAAAVASDTAVVAGAGADAAVVDAAVARTVASCAPLKADRKWAELETCARDVQSKELEQLAILESKAEATARDVETSLRGNNIKIARLKLGAIPASSVYFAATKTKLEKAEAAAKAAVAPKTCDPACSDGFVCRGTTCTKKEPAANLCADTAALADLEAKAESSLLSGSYTAALSSFEKVFLCKPAVAVKAYLAACKARNFPKAKTYFRLVGRDSIVQICLKEGFDPRI